MAHVDLVPFRSVRTHDDHDDTAAVALGGGRQAIAGALRITGFQAIHTRDFAEQVVVVLHRNDLARDALALAEIPVADRSVFQDVGILQQVAAQNCVVTWRTQIAFRDLAV